MDNQVRPAGGAAERPIKPVDTKQRILRVAQEAFADLGINGTSLRRISELSGSRNVMAAQYHFGSRDALISAIIDLNRQRLEKSRAEICGNNVVTLRDLGVRELFRLVIKPFMGDGDEGRSFVRFLRALVQHSPYYALWADRPATTPITRAIYDRLRSATVAVPEPVWQMRMTMIGKLVVNAISDFDALDGCSEIGPEAFSSDLVEIAAAILQAPWASGGPDGEHVSALCCADASVAASPRSDGLRSHSKHAYTPAPGMWKENKHVSRPDPPGSARPHAR